jgi:hypothetical protein
MQTTEIIELPSALQSVLQTIFYSAGLFFIFKLIYAKNKMCGNLAFFGGVLIIVGETLKCLQLISIALDNVDKPNLGNSLLVFLSSGFICVAFALWRCGMRVGTMNLAHVWTIPLSLTTLVLVVAGYSGFFTKNKAWFFILLVATALANVALLLQLIYRSLKPTPNWIAVGFFILNLIVILICYKNMNPNSVLPGFNQNLLTLGHASFAIAAWFYSKKEA